MRSILLMILFVYGGTARTQSREGMELYHYSGCGAGLPSFSSKAFYQGSTKWYAELRYNYEAGETFACSAGRTFLKEGDWTYSLTPIAGLSVGKLRGISFGMNSYVSYKAVSISSSVHYGISSGSGENNLFSWSELNGQLSEHFYAGCTLQQTCTGQSGDKWEPGMQMGITFKGWSIPLYAFYPGAWYFVLGVCREWKN